MGEFAPLPGTRAGKGFVSKLWTPVDASAGGLAITVAAANVPNNWFQQTGRAVIINFQASWPVTADGNNAAIKGHPIAIRGTGWAVVSESVGGPVLVQANKANNVFFFFNQDTLVQLTNANLSGVTLQWTVIYHV